MIDKKRGVTKMEAKNCPHKNTEWYDITDLETGRQGKHVKICVRPGCTEDCDKIVTEEGRPSYDPDGEIKGGVNHGRQNDINLGIG